MLEDFNRILGDYWRTLLNTFWFVPGLISLVGPLLAFCLLTLDYDLNPDRALFIFSGGVTEANTILSTIAGSLITVAGLAFSITIVVLQLVSSEYTPRALRGFLQDRVTQVVAGGFFAIFAYSLIVLARVRESSPTDPGFLPVLSITIAIGLGFLGLVLLLIFVHHTGRIIQVSDIAARLTAQTIQAIHQPPYLELEKETQQSKEAQEGKEVSRKIQSWYTKEVGGRICATRPGYVQRIELAHLFRSSLFLGLHLRLLVCPGDFVTEETVIAELWPAQSLNEERRKTIHKNIIIERERDITQDVRFGVRQLADIALRALSPAVNDPTTGVLCIKYLQAVFEHLIQHTTQVGIYRFVDENGGLEIRQPAFQEYLEVFPEIGHYAGGNVRVIETLLTALTNITEVATRLKQQEYQDMLTAAAAALAAQSAAS
jgi:uncharacterized membrane protein